MAAVRTPAINGGLVMVMGFRCLDSSIAAPAIRGVLRRKENLAAVSLFRFLIKPPVIVIPERETPGIIASAWATPTTRQSRRFISEIPFCFLESLSDM